MNDGLFLLFFIITRHYLCDRWVFHFAHLRQLPVLVPYMPTENPQLSDTAYEVCTVSYTSLTLWL